MKGKIGKYYKGILLGAMVIAGAIIPAAILFGYHAAGKKAPEEKEEQEESRWMAFI